MNGYQLVVLSDLATGIPLVWRLLPAGAGYNDHHALLLLLDDLFALDPEFPTEAIVADKAWNSEDSVRDCAVRYGIHLVSGLDVTTEQREVRELPERCSGVLGGYDGPGNVYCKQHGTVMNGALRSSSVAKTCRGGTQAWCKEAPQIDSNFRHRLKCEHGGGPCEQKPTLPMSVDWNGFSYYPHAIDGGREARPGLPPGDVRPPQHLRGDLGALKLGQKLGWKAPTAPTPRTRTRSKPSSRSDC